MTPEDLAQRGIRTRGTIHVDIQEVEAEILGAEFQGHPTQELRKRLVDLRAEMAAAEADHAARIAAQIAEEEAK